MKKKIKDLTEEERKIICEKNYCWECPLSTKDEGDDRLITVKCFADKLEEEVEIPEVEPK